MNGYILAAVVAVISYLIGSVNFSILLSRIIGKKDIRKSGSGNAGATNMLRTYGKKMGIITLVLDVAKGIAAIMITVLIVKLYARYMMVLYFQTGDVEMTTTPYITLDSLKYLSGLCVVLGHDFPLYFGFKGGKGVATSLGVVLMLDWKVGVIALVVALAVMALTRFVSLGSVVGGAVFIIAGTWSILYQSAQSFSAASFGTRLSNAFGMLLAGEAETVKVICVILIGGLLIFKHRSNISRLVHGAENKLSFKKEK